MINTQRLVKPVANWSRRSLIPFATPFQTHESVPMRVSARMLLPTSFSIQTGELFQSIKKQANLFPIDIRLLSQRIGGPHDSVFLDSSGAFLYINYADQLNNQYKSTAVIFPDGALVTWYMKREEEIMLASNIRARRPPPENPRSPVAGNAAADHFAHEPSPEDPPPTAENDPPCS